MLTLVLWFRWCWSGFFTTQLLGFFFLHSNSEWKWITKTRSHSRGCFVYYLFWKHFKLLEDIQKQCDAFPLILCIDSSLKTFSIHTLSTSVLSSANIHIILVILVLFWWNHLTVSGDNITPVYSENKESFMINRMINFRKFNININYYQIYSPALQLSLAWRIWYSPLAITITLDMLRQEFSDIGK